MPLSPRILSYNHAFPGRIYRFSQTMPDIARPVRIYVHFHLSIHPCIYLSTCLPCTYTYNMCVCIHTHTYTHIYIYIYTYIYIYIGIERDRERKSDLKKITDIHRHAIWPSSFTLNPLCYSLLRSADKVTYVYLHMGFGCFFDGPMLGHPRLVYNQTGVDRRIFESWP